MLFIRLCSSLEQFLYFLDSMSKRKNLVAHETLMILNVETVQKFYLCAFLIAVGEMCRRYPRATEVNILGVPSVDMISMDVLFTLR